jgi:predicted RNase H-like HicB family nuclease
MFNYPARFNRAGGGYFVRVPGLPKVVTEGDSIEEGSHCVRASARWI